MSLLITVGETVFLILIGGLFPAEKFKNNLPKGDTKMGTCLYISNVSDEQLCTLLDLRPSTLEAYAIYAELKEGLQQQSSFLLYQLVQHFPDLQKLKDYKTFGLGKVRGLSYTGFTDDENEVEELLYSVNRDSLVGKVKALHWA